MKEDFLTSADETISMGSAAVQNLICLPKTVLDCVVAGTGLLRQLHVPLWLGHLRCQLYARPEGQRGL